MSQRKRISGACKVWFYASVQSQVPGETESQIDLFQGNMLEIKKQDCGSLKSKHDVFSQKKQKQKNRLKHIKMLTFTFKLKKAIKKASA